MLKSGLEYSLKPRLLMFQHLSEHLKQELALYAEQAYACLTGTKPVQWEAFHTLSSEQQFCTVRSTNPLIVPEYQGIASSMQGKAVQGLSDNQDYTFPELHFSLLTPQGQVHDECMIQPGRVHVHPSNHPEKQVLEYLSTVLDLELSQWHFNCFRKNQVIGFKAQKDIAGWNLRLSKIVMPDLPAANICIAGLSEGQSTCDEGQENGQMAFLFWGPYLINGQTCEICLPGSSTREGFASAFLQELQHQIAHTHIRAFWDAEMHLNLQSTRKNIDIHIGQVTVPPITSPHRSLNLSLPLGEHASPSIEKGLLGSIFLNQIEIKIPGRSNKSDPSDTFWLLDVINTATPQTHIIASLTGTEQLKLEGTRPLKSISLVCSSASIADILGLQSQATKPVNKANLNENIERWQHLLERICTDLSSISEPSQWVHNFLTQVKQMPGFLGANGTHIQINPAGWRHYPNQATTWLEELSKSVQDWLNSLTSQSTTQSSEQALALHAHHHTLSPNIQVQTEQLPRAEAADNEKPKPTFDHKI